jgi:hypothetical protein
VSTTVRGPRRLSEIECSAGVIRRLPCEGVRRSCGTHIAAAAEPCWHSGFKQGEEVVENELLIATIAVVVLIGARPFVIRSARGSNAGNEDHDSRHVSTSPAASAVVVPPSMPKVDPWWRFWTRTTA